MGRGTTRTSYKSNLARWEVNDRLIGQRNKATLTGPLEGKKLPTHQAKAGYVADVDTDNGYRFAATKPVHLQPSHLTTMTTCKVCTVLFSSKRLQVAGCRGLSKFVRLGDTDSSSDKLRSATNRP